MTLGTLRQRQQAQHKDTALTHPRPCSPQRPSDLIRAHDFAFTSSIRLVCYHKAICNISKNSGCALTSASDPECWDAQMDAHTYTCIETRVSGAVLEACQCCFVIESSLLWQTRCLFHFFLSLPPIFFTLPLTFSFECRGGPVPHFARCLVSHLVASAVSVLPQLELQLSVASAACF